jgi:hypothetical protein
MTAFHYRAVSDGEVTPTGVALVETCPMRLARQPSDTFDRAAVGAERAVWPADGFHMSAGGIFIVEDWISKVHGHGG